MLDRRLLLTLAHRSLVWLCPVASCNKKGQLRQRNFCLLAGSLDHLAGAVRATCSSAPFLFLAAGPIQRTAATLTAICAPVAFAQRTLCTAVPPTQKASISIAARGQPVRSRRRKSSTSLKLRLMIELHEIFKGRDGIEDEREVCL